jgi:hypothetical protein
MGDAWMNRWAIFLDVEGSSKIYPRDKVRFFNAFDELLSAVCRIGKLVYPETPQRIFAHQVGGDGLIIVSEFAEGVPEIPISIAVILMQVLLVNGAVAKVGISDGDFGDVSSCFPSMQFCPRVGDRTFQLGGGRLTIFPVMGTALINAHHFATLPPRGCRLAVDQALLDTTTSGVVITHSEKDYVIVDWVHTRTAEMENIFAKTALRLPPAGELENILIDYVRDTGDLYKTEWGQNSLMMNGCPWVKGSLDTI